MAFASSAEEAKLLERSKSGRDVNSDSYVFECFGYRFTGKITVNFANETLEFANEIQAGKRIYSRGYEYGSHDVECLLSVVLNCDDFQHKCGNSYAGLDPQHRSHRSSVCMTVGELKNAVPDRFEDQVCLSITATLTIFGKLSSSSWTETPWNSASCTSSSAAKIPFLKHLSDLKYSDLVIECDGHEYPVHSLILKCTSPVFAVMLETDMKEAASGRIKIEDVSSGAVERMIGFIYTGTLFSAQVRKNELSDDLITELLHCAEKYGIPEMKQEVFAHMRSKLTYHNALKFLKAAELYGAGDGMVKEILNFCRQRLMELPKGTELEEFVARYSKDLFGERAVK